MRSVIPRQVVSRESSERAQPSMSRTQRITNELILWQQHYSTNVTKSRRSWQQWPDSRVRTTAVIMRVFVHWRTSSSLPPVATESTALSPAHLSNRTPVVSVRSDSSSPEFGTHFVVRRFRDFVRLFFGHCAVFYPLSMARGYLDMAA